MKRPILRREFLKNAVAAAGGLSLAGCAASQRKPLIVTRGSPNEKLNIGIIGVNNRGKNNTEGVQSENIAALCDIDERYLGEASQ
ncbi:MAG: gfo/Idh/MocA family oxidoreductase, partial [Planctomycetes bacterium]|nr:gfo/Idh/MocA family oxidoreductase [Planctomycetota bacterium]